VPVPRSGATSTTTDHFHHSWSFSCLLSAVVFICCYIFSALGQQSMVGEEIHLMGMAHQNSFPSSCALISFSALSFLPCVEFTTWIRFSSSPATSFWRRFIFGCRNRLNPRFSLQFLFVGRRSLGQVMPPLT
jgi:hypothetical protein